MRAILSRILGGESGATAIEYGAIAALLSLALIGGAEAIGISLLSIFEQADAGLAITFPP